MNQGFDRHIPTKFAVDPGILTLMRKQKAVSAVYIHRPAVEDFGLMEWRRIGP